MRLFAVSLLLFSVILLNSCIDEDMDSCPSQTQNNLILNFVHTDDQGNDLFMDHIHRVDLFIFDNRQCFVTKQTVDQASLSAFAGVKLNLLPGTYRIICWGNAADKTLFGGLNTGDLFSKAFLSNATLSGTTTGTNGDELYYGSTLVSDTPGRTLRVTVPPTGTQTDSVIFRSAHIKIEVYVKGFEDKLSTGDRLPPRIELTHIPDKFNFNMQPFGSDISYSNIAVYRTIKNEQMAVMDFYPLLFDGQTLMNVLIKRQSDDSTITTVSLKDFIQKNNINLTGSTEIVIPILVEYKSASVSISLPGWVQNPIGPDL